MHVPPQGRLDLALALLSNSLCVAQAVEFRSAEPCGMGEAELGFERCRVMRCQHPGWVLLPYHIHSSNHNTRRPLLCRHCHGHARDRLRRQVS